MWHNTKITRLLGIKYPIFQGPFGGGLSSVKLTSVVSNLGGFGSYGIHHLAPEKIIELDKELKSLTKNPYALNLWVNTKDEGAQNYSDQEFDKLSKLYKPYFDELAIPLPPKPALPDYSFEDQVDAVLKAKPPVLSFVFGIPSPKVIAELKSKQIILIGTATTADEALALEAAGVDAVVVTGFEAGGHRVSFLKSAEESLTGTFVLIQQAASKVRIPIIAAGGIGDGKGIAAALNLGADAVQIGTAFLACEESGANEIHKTKLFSDEAKHTALTRTFTGRLARGMQSRISRDLSKIENGFAPYPLQGIFLRPLRQAAEAQGKHEIIMYWAGQIASTLKYKKASELFESLVSETGSILGR